MNRFEDMTTDVAEQAYKAVEQNISEYNALVAEGNVDAAVAHLDGWMPFFMHYETKYNRMNRYMDIYRLFINLDEMMQSVKSDGDKETVVNYAKVLLDTVQEMDEQIFYEYRKLASMFRACIDTLVVASYLEGLAETSKKVVADMVTRGIELEYLPVRYKNYTK